MRTANANTGTCLWLLGLCLSVVAGCAGNDTFHNGSAPGFDLRLQPAGRLIARLITGQGVLWDPGDVLTLRNAGTHGFPYVVEGSVPWLVLVGSASGIVGPQQSVSIRLAIERNAAPDTPGVHLGELRVLNAITFHRECAVEVACVVGRQ